MTDIMPYGTEDTNPPAEPLTREEQYLSAIAGVTSSSDIPEKPLTRVEKYLNKIVENGGGGGGGGTTDYTQLSNKPQINSHELSGNKSSSDLGLQSEVLGSWTAGTATSHSTPVGTDTVYRLCRRLITTSETMKLTFRRFRHTSNLTARQRLTTYSRHNLQTLPRVTFG